MSRVYYAFVVMAPTNISKVLKKTMGEKFHIEMKGYVRIYIHVNMYGGRLILTSEYGDYRSLTCRERRRKFSCSASGGCEKIGR